jgi:tetratricopeptide (TPR) repeat protein
MREENKNRLNTKIQEWKEHALQYPDDDVSIYNVGYFIYLLYEVDEEENTYNDCCKYLEQASVINKENADAWGLWSIIEYRKAINENNRTLLIDSLEKCKKAYKINPQFYSYNLALIYASLKNKARALYYLNESIKNKIITEKDIANDKEWNDYLPDVKNLLSYHI